MVMGKWSLPNAESWSTVHSHFAATLGVVNVKSIADIEPSGDRRVPLPSFKITRPFSSMKDSSTFPLPSFFLPPQREW